jgi:hypothetical protein
MTTLDIEHGILLLGRSVKDLRSVVASLLGSWERISDPMEQTVLEAVCNRYAYTTVINYDALRAQKYENAYGMIAPTTDDIVQFLRQRYDAGELSGRIIVEDVLQLPQAVVDALQAEAYPIVKTKMSDN